MPARERLDRWKEGFKDLLGIGSRARATSLPNTRQPSPSPRPPNLPRSVTPLPGAAVSSTQADTGSHLLSPSTGTVPSQPITTATSSVPLGPVQDPLPVAPTPVVPPNPTQNTSSNEGTSVERVESMVWPGLKALLKVVDASADIFPPLKSAVGGLNQCIEIFESASKGRKDYGELQSKLDSLLEDLSQFLGNMEDWRMTASMTNLSMGLNKEVKFVQQKRERGAVNRHVEALGDSEEIMECYRRIQGHLERLTLNANLSMWETANKLEMGLKETRLQKLLPTMSAVYDSAESQDVKRGACTPGTREREITELLDWAHDRKAGDVYWINGMAGTGKTTIAYSLCDELKKTAGLGASFFCSRLIPECRNVKFILPAVVYQLARFSYPFRCALLKVLEADPDAHTRVLKTQFENLLVKPLSDVKHTLPDDFVVVIDALDECENEDSVGQILEVLLESTHTLQLPVRFLVSSRPESMIYSRMMKRLGTKANARLVLHELDAKDVKRDIETYLRAELEEVGLEPSQIEALAGHSGILFIYAATAARYIKDGKEQDVHEERLNMVLGLSPAVSDKDQVIDLLYSTILKAAFKSQRLDTTDKLDLKAILDTVICAQEPLTAGALAGLLKIKSDKRVAGLLRTLYSVLNHSEASGLVTTLHASFPDFMLNEGRSSSFHCDPKANHGRLAQAAFDVIRTHNPRFNLCELRSSYIRDEEVADITKHVPPELFYSCQYWISHMERSDQLTDAGKLVYEFLSVRLLLWAEVLNVKRSIHLGPRIIQRAENWSRTNNYSNETTELAHDAWRFVTMFASHAVSQSTPHIYISMLPFWPEASPIAKYYGKRMQGAIQARGTAMNRRQLALLATWPLDTSLKSACFSPDNALIAVGVSSAVYVRDSTTGRTAVDPLAHQGTVTSVAFSPDGSLITAGSEGGEICVWTAQSGQAVVAPFPGHTNEVTSVCFSSDSKRIASGSGDETIKIWDVPSGCTLITELKGHTDWVRSVCFSADDSRIVSGSDDRTVRVWDAQSGHMVLGPLQGHTYWIRSVCFSPDGMRIASGSQDKTIRGWSAKDGQTIGDPLGGHSDYVLSVAFSPDGKLLASGSNDTTIRLWDLTSDPISARILEGHTGPVTSVAFSSDGSRIVSCSSDNTIRVWDARSRATVADSLEGHTGTVWSVGYSPDGKHIVSGSGDKTIRMWDAESGQMVGGPLEGHTGGVWSVCFSPDGRRIVSGSDDRTIRAWDVQSGQTVVGPLEGHTDWVRSVCYSPDGALIASGSDDKTIRVWDAQDGKPVGNPLEGHDGYVLSVCFSPNNTRIASGSNDSTILVWDAQSGQTVAGPLEGHSEYVISVCFSPDGTCLASGSGDKTVRVWDVQQGQAILGPLKGHTEAIYSVCFSPSGTLIVSGSEDKTVRLWDARSGQAVGDPLVGHTGPVWSVAFSPDGKHIVSGSEDQTIRVWDVDGILRMYGAADSLPSPGLGPISPPRPHESWVLREDGWVVDRESRLLAWVPPDLHAPLLRPHNTLAILPKGCFKLDFDSAKLGESWAECYQPPSS